MTTAQDPTLAQRWELATRFPWARRECPGHDTDPNVPSRDTDMGSHHAGCLTGCVCEGLGYLPLPPNDMLAAVLRECRERPKKFVAIQWADGQWELFENTWTATRGWGVAKAYPHSTLFAAFLAATEGEAPITERSLAEAGGSGPLTEEVADA